MATISPERPLSPQTRLPEALLIRVRLNSNFQSVSAESSQQITRTFLSCSYNERNQVQKKKKKAVYCWQGKARGA